MPVYPRVAVSLPSKVTGSEAEEEWQEVDWVTWATGDLTVDDDYLLVFKPAGKDGVKSKSLGNVVRASVVSNQDEGRTLVVTTSDSLHRVYRFTFERSEQASDFNERARMAEERAQKEVDHGGGEEASESAHRLEAAIREKMASRSPLVYSGAELYGPDPGGDSGNEVLLGRGAFVLLDPAETAANKIGTYELLFFSEEEAVNPAGPAQKFTIGQKMALGQPKCEDGFTSFELRSPTGVNHSIQFDGANTASSFSRDYRVRQCLMEMAVKTVQGRHKAQDLKAEIDDMKRRSCCNQIMHFLSVVFVLLLIAAVIRLAMLYAEEKGRPASAYLAALLGDLSLVARVSRTAASTTTAKVCGLAAGIGGAVPVTELEACLGLSGSQVKKCVEELIGR